MKDISFQWDSYQNKRLAFLHRRVYITYIKDFLSLHGFERDDRDQATYPDRETEQSQATPSVAHTGALAQKDLVWKGENCIKQWTLITWKAVGWPM